MKQDDVPVGSLKDLQLLSSVNSCQSSGLPTIFMLPACESDMRLTKSRLAMTVPTATAVMRSTNTVNRKVVSIINMPERGALRIRLKYFQSTISNPTLSNIPASTACGICSASAPRPKTINNRTSACKAPEIGVRPPARTLTTVRMVAPAPGKPPNKPLTTLPMPWPNNSRSDLWCVRVMLSAINEVNKESMEPRNAKHQ